MDTSTSADEAPVLIRCQVSTLGGNALPPWGVARMSYYCWRDHPGLHGARVLGIRMAAEGTRTHRLVPTVLRRVRGVIS
ncbi:unnamed protein product, partial [Polarella glacialis]